ncbi:MAG: hypothetical protein MK135_06885 [Polyangiaceae bacterium]|nr:hypothetical protein [Polyangiaceae bacterium]
MVAKSNIGAAEDDHRGRRSAAGRRSWSSISSQDARQIATRLLREVKWVRRRELVQRALARPVRGLVLITFLLSALILGYGMSGAARVPWVPGAVLVFLALFGIAYAREAKLFSLPDTIPWIDRRVGADGRLEALLFGWQDGFRGPYEAGYFDLARREAAAYLERLTLARVARLRMAFWFKLFSPLALTGLAILLPLPELSTEEKTAIQVPEVSGLDKVEGVELSVDESEIFQRRLAEIEAGSLGERALSLLNEYERLLARLGKGELNQTQALRSLHRLEASVEESAQLSLAQQRAMAARGRELGKSSLGGALANALEGKRWVEASEAFQELAERLRQGVKPLSPEELDQLRNALDKASQQQESTSESRNDGSQRGGGGQGEPKKSLLSQEEMAEKTAGETAQAGTRRLKKLGRNSSQREAKKSTPLSELDRQLQEAAQALAEGQKDKASRFLDQAAKTTQTLKKEMLSDDEKRTLLQELKRLKERLQKRDSDAQQKRRRRFSDRARGESQAASDRRNQKGRGGASGRQGMSLGTESAANSQRGGEQKQGRKQGGSAPGEAHDPRLSAEASPQPGASYQDKAAAAQDTGQGRSASETILTAAKKGFRQPDYEKLFRQYESVSEEVLRGEKYGAEEEILVESYFELIRPRTTQSSREGAKN